MLKHFGKHLILGLAITVLAAAAMTEYHLLRNSPEKKLVDNFREVMNKNEKELKSLMVKAGDLLTSKDFNGQINEALIDLLPQLESEGKAILVYRYEMLTFWSDRGVAFFDKLDNYETHNGIIQLRNGYYLITSMKFNEYDVLGLLLIKNNYIYENKYLNNRFYSDYKLPEDYKLLQYESSGSFPVSNSDGELLFYMKPSGDYLSTKMQLYLPALLYLAGLFILLIYIRHNFLGSSLFWPMRMLRLMAVVFGIYWIHLIFKIPEVLYSFRIFGPVDFALNTWLPSLGDFFLVSFLLLFWIYNYITVFNFKSLLDELNLPVGFLVFLLMLFNIAVYLFSDFLISKLILDSTISFALNQITGITVQSIIGLMSIGFLLFGTIIITLKLSEELKEKIRLAREMAIAIVAAVTISLIQLIVISKVNIPVAGLFVAVTFFAALFSKEHIRNYKISYLIVFISIVSAYSLIVFYHNINKKERQQQKTMAVNLVSDRDPAAEIFLGEVQNQIMRDPRIPGFILRDQRNLIPDYLVQTYFNGYFRKYDTRIYICSQNDTLNIIDESRYEPCVPFFEKKFKSNGIQISGTNFYFMDNMNGRVSYAGSLFYPFLTDGSGIYIFVEMDSELLFEGIGFPELLIDKNFAKPADYSKFSYAKYYGGELTDKKGEYNYNMYVDTYLKDTAEYQYFRRDGLEHLLYHSRQENYILVSRMAFTVSDYLISFPYMFVFFFVLSLLLVFIGKRGLIRWAGIVDLKFKIQMAIVSIVFLSLLVVAVVTLYTNIEDYKNKHRDDLNEKMKSIAEEINQRVQDIDEITPDMQDWLNLELFKLSNIFRTDINIFDNKGRKVSSSRPEVFDRGLISDRINPRAKFEIEQNLSVIIQPENIGELSYLSAYKPIVNNRGDITGIVNLPYFIRQDIYRQQISTFIVAFINLYVLLLLASIIIAVFIASQITRPLADIQVNLKKMKFGKPNEPISYSRNDEIGTLVKEYNKKVEELAVSAELLAREERESAWREMAKQIAHEIKNPLTPMKLNIQYLQRAKKNTPEFADLVERVTETLIEQIDNLSNIASEFSSFAQIPKARNQVFRLAEQLQKVIDLYETRDLAIIEFHPNGLDDVLVHADREQLGRAIINLIRNGIQAMPEGQVGKIEVALGKNEDKAIISVHDNGTGIPEELQEKLFGPSFTTKSSGMGLGLAIVKNIVENFSGTIWFETKINSGTTFFIEIPVYHPDTEINIS